MSFGFACYTLPPITPKFNYEYLIADYKLSNSVPGTVNIIRDIGEFKNNLTGGTGNINSEYLSVKTPFTNNNIEYENSTQELIVYGKFSYDTLPPNSNIFYFSTDSNIRNVLKADVLQNSNIRISYSNINIGYYSNIINPLSELGEPPPYNFIFGIYNNGLSNILDSIILNSDNTIYQRTQKFILLHNIFDNYHKNILSLGSSNIQLYDFRVYNNVTLQSLVLPSPITPIVFISLYSTIILDATNFKNIGLNALDIFVPGVDNTKINDINNTNIYYIAGLNSDSAYTLNIETFDNYLNTYSFTETINTSNNPNLINPIQRSEILSNNGNLNSNSIRKNVVLNSVLYTNIGGVPGLSNTTSYGITLTSSNIGSGNLYSSYTNSETYSDMYINQTNWKLTVSINNLESGNSYIPNLSTQYSNYVNITGINVLTQANDEISLPEFRITVV
jgi:hypothetical protein